MKVNLSVPCEFTDEQVEGAVMAILKHQPMTNGEFLRKFSVPCWDVVNDALTRLLAEKKVRETERLDGMYFIRNDYQDWVRCPHDPKVTCSNHADIENPLYSDGKKLCAACGREI